MTLLPLLFQVLFFGAAAIAEPESYIVDPQTYVGNVYGSVVDQTDGASLRDALVTILDEDASTTLQSRSDERGRFLINFVPTPFDGRSYRVTVTRDGYVTATIPGVQVLPGATMALETQFRLARKGGVRVAASASQSAWHYRHETNSIVFQPRPFARTVFATREGLVGGTTANGHIITPNDRFAALPSRRALTTNFGHEREVRVTHIDRSTVVPVWDVGPWNTHDDYWNPASVRESFNDLPRGKPEAQAAFFDGYNGGRDERGRVVRTPAGIDLADGTFWLDLGLTNNDWVNVEYLWVESDAPSKRRVVQH